jgi:hypothetical protein
MRDWRLTQRGKQPQREAQVREDLIRFLTSPHKLTEAVFDLAAEQYQAGSV